MDAQLSLAVTYNDTPPPFFLFHFLHIVIFETCRHDTSGRVKQGVCFDRRTEAKHPSAEIRLT